MPIKRILVPTDFSESSAYACQYALTFAQDIKAELYLVHAIYNPLRLRGYDFGGVVEGLVKQAQGDLTRQVEQIRGKRVTVHSRVLIGVEYQEIAEFAEAHQIDLIIMATHGRTGLAHAFLGSVAERVVRTAPCPVLTVKMPARKETALEPFPEQT